MMTEQEKLNPSSELAMSICEWSNAEEATSSETASHLLELLKEHLTLHGKEAIVEPAQLLLKTAVKKGFQSLVLQIADHILTLETDACFVEKLILNLLKFNETVESKKQRELVAISIVALSNKSAMDDWGTDLKQGAVKFVRECLAWNETKGSLIRKCGLALLAGLAPKSTKWTYFFQLYEALEEPQSHIVKPVLRLFLPLMESFASKNSEVSVDTLGLDPFGIQWLLTLFDKGFLHTNGWIRLWMIHTFLKTKLEPEHDPQSLGYKFVFSTLLPRLIMDHDIFRRLHLESSVEPFIRDANSWLSRLLESLPSIHITPEKFAMDILQTLIGTTWNPSSITFITHVLAQHPGVGYASSDQILQLLRSAFQKGQEIQIINLRRAILQNLATFFVRGFVGTEEGRKHLVLLIAEFLPLHPSSFLSKLQKEHNDQATSESLNPHCTDPDNHSSARQMLNRATLLLGNDIASKKVEEYLMAGLSNVHERAYVEEREVDWQLALYLTSLETDLSINIACCDPDIIQFLISTISSQTNLDRWEFFELIWLPLLSRITLISALHESITGQLIYLLPKEEVRSCFAAAVCAKCYVPVPTSATDKLEYISRYLKTPFLLKQTKTETHKKKRKFAIVQSSFVVDLWIMLLHQITTESGPDHIFSSMLDLWELSLDCLLEFTHLQSMLLVVKQILVKIHDPEQVISTMESIWTAVKEYHKTEFYVPALEEMCAVVFQPDYLTSPHKGVQSYLETVTESLLTDAASNSATSVVLGSALHKMFRELSDWDFLESDIHLWATKAVQLATFGSGRKQERTTDVACRFLEKNNCEDSNKWSKDHLSVQYTRLYGVSMASLIAQHSGEGCSSLVHASFDRWDSDEAAQKSQSFGLSHGHRLKNRILALLLVIIDHLSDEAVLERVFEKCMKWLGQEFQQSSARLLTEWIILKSIHIAPKALLHKFLQSEEHCADTRLGSVSSWLTILMHLAVIENENEESNGELQPDKVLLRVFPWCTTQNFTVRCSALGVFKRLWKLFGTEHSPLSPAFEACANFKTENRNGLKIVDNFLNDFYVSDFHPLKDHCLQNIFVAVPTHTGIPEDEQLKWEWFESVGFEGCPLTQPHRPDLLSLESTIWKGGENASNIIEVEGMIEVGLEDSFQRKVRTSAVSELERQIAMTNPKGTSESEKDVSLVLVASLVSRASNLGGLCRSCEIFGVDEYVIDSKRILEDETFKSLSVSSHGWVNMTEVRHFDLIKFLKKKKAEGYTVVGAEQTSNSSSLESYNFSPKTVLVLGREKEGIPLELIKCLDVCVETPQLGIIRSLNVHVSGALLIWEFAKQWKFSEQS